MKKKFIYNYFSLITFPKLSQLFSPNTKHFRKLLKISGDTCNAETQYTCDDGTCIDKEKQCDKHRDCSEGDDEDDCEEGIHKNVNSKFSINFHFPFQK